MTGARVDHSDFRIANLSAANLKDAHWRTVDLREANLSGANLRKTD